MGGGSRGTRSTYTRSRSSYSSDLRNHVSAEQTAPRAFISFHIDDEAQVELLRHQARDDSFNLEFVDTSVKEPFDSDEWRRKVTERIEGSEVVIVAIGDKTHERPAVLWEIKKAQELGKPVIGVRLYKDEDHKIPEPMQRGNIKIVNWNMEDIQGAIDGATND